MQKTIFFDLEVYSYQIDLLGHVNNAIYIQWMEIGRTKLLEVVGLPTPEIVKQGFAPVLVHTSITYKSPLFLGDRVSVNVWVSQLKNASAIVQFRFHNQEKILAAEGLQKGLFLDLHTMHPRRLSPEEKALFAQYLCQEIPIPETETEFALETIST
ncbi:acyl-CoA thioesterase [Chroococcidiopsis sp.]|uniref:acyl-CoA thioesterase n=1 Tax=Chroococcidiopsis sp. TaxID=3088168 RepID=UPI003F38F37A